MIDYIKIDLGGGDGFEIDLREKRYVNLFDVAEIGQILSGRYIDCEFMMSTITDFIKVFIDRFIYLEIHHDTPGGDVDWPVFCKLGFDDGYIYDYGVENGEVFYEMLTDNKNHCIAYYNAGDDKTSELFTVGLYTIMTGLVESVRGSEGKLDLYDQNFLDFINPILPALDFDVVGLAPGGNVIKEYVNTGREVDMPVDTMGSGFKKTVEILFQVYKTRKQPALFIIPSFTEQLHPLLGKALYMIVKEHSQAKYISTFQYNVE